MLLLALLSTRQGKVTCSPSAAVWSGGSLTNFWTTGVVEEEDDRTWTQKSGMKETQTCILLITSPSDYRGMRIVSICRSVLSLNISRATRAITFFDVCLTWTQNSWLAFSLSLCSNLPHRTGVRDSWWCDVYRHMSLQCFPSCHSRC